MSQEQDGLARTVRRTLYIVRRTQLYLDDQLWSALHARARKERTTVSELVRQALREHYADNHAGRAKAMLNVVGIQKPETGQTGAVESVRILRRGNRLNRLQG